MTSFQLNGRPVTVKGPDDAPLLWVIPLALYLFTFVIVFQPRPILPHAWMVWAQPVLVAAVIAVGALEIVDNIAVILGVHLLAFFVTAMMCHGELVRRLLGPAGLEVQICRTLGDLAATIDDQAAAVVPI